MPNLIINLFFNFNEINLDYINIDFDKYDCDVVEYISGFVVKSVGIHLSRNICFKFALKHASDKHTKNNWINFKEKYCLNHPQKEIVDICIIRRSRA